MGRGLACALGATRGSFSMKRTWKSNPEVCVAPRGRGTPAFAGPAESSAPPGAGPRRASLCLTGLRSRFCLGGALALLFVFGPGLSAAQSPGSEGPEAGFARIEPARDMDWRDLFVGLAAGRNRQARFEERRYFPFRRDPVVLGGELRISAGRGLSLSYQAPTPSVVIVDEKGVLLRNELGEEREAPADDRIRTATATLGRLLQLNLTVLEQEFEIHGRRDGSSWSLQLRPRQESLAGLFGRIGLSGEGIEMRRITMGRSATQRVEIEISEARDGVLFTADTLRRFFR